MLEKTQILERQSGRTRWLFGTIVLAFALLALIHPFSKLSGLRFSWRQEKPECMQDAFHASRQNVWEDLSPKEANEVLKFLLSNSDLNLTEAYKATRSASHLKDVGL